jgi:hypothetical protein
MKALMITQRYSTVYHAQTDGQSERTNQTIETYLRYVIASLDKVTDWPLVLPAMQRTFNSTRNASTNATPHELMYGLHLPTPPNVAL